MNKINLPESELSSWRPRHPSAGLKRRIFATAERSTLATRWLWGALTPTMACLLLCFIMLNSSNSTIHRKPAMSLVLSNQSSIFSDGEGETVGENRLASVTFDWTNHSVFNSSMRFTPTTNLSN